MTSRAKQSAVRLLSKGRSWESPGERAVCTLRWTVDDGLWLAGDLWLAGRRKFRGTRRRWGQMLSEFQAEIPYPLPDDLVERVPTRGVRAQTIEILLDIFISEHGFKRTAMQIQVQHISGGKSRSSEGGHEQLVNNSITLRADPVCSASRGMGSHDQPHMGSRRSAQEHFGTIIQISHHPALCMGAPGNRKLRQHRQHFCAIQKSVIAAASNKAQAGREHLDHHRRITIFAIQTDEDLRGCEMVLGRIAERNQARTCQFSTIIPIARSSIRAHQLMGVGLQDRRTCPYHFSALATLVTGFG